MLPLLDSETINNDNTGFPDHLLVCDIVECYNIMDCDDSCMYFQRSKHDRYGVTIEAIKASEYDD